MTTRRAALPHQDLVGRRLPLFDSLSTGKALVGVYLPPCAGCAGREGELTPGIQSHPLSVRCASCRRHLTRLPHSAIQALVTARVLT